MVTKTQNEAVTEGMGSVLDKHAEGHRHLSMDAYVQEAFIHWNGPTTNECEGVLIAALNNLFKGKERNFTHTDTRDDSRAISRIVSKVVDRHLSQRSKFPFMGDRDA